MRSLCYCEFSWRSSVYWSCNRGLKTEHKKKD